MERYLGEKEKVLREASQRNSTLEEVFYAPDYLRLYLKRRSRREKIPEQIASLEGDTTSAQIITTGLPMGTPKRCRYHLCQSEQGWRINEIEWECLVCHGAGEVAGGTCETCEGKGWRDCIKRDA